MCDSALVEVNCVSASFSCTMISGLITLTVALIRGVVDITVAIIRLIASVFRGGFR